MRVVEIREGWGLQNLVLTERERPKPGPGDVLMRVTHASLNFRDWLMVQGKYNPRQRLPLVPGSDGAGVIEACGDGVERFAPGDRVVGSFFRDWVAGRTTKFRLKSALGGPLDGMLTQYFCAPASAFSSTPEHLSDAEAATLPCAALTAWNALVVHGRLSAGETVLVLGTGGVSMFALQIAQMHGARVIATSSSDDKLAVLRDEYGVTDLINYRETPEWGREVRSLAGVGVDHVVEVGGAGTMEQSIRAVRPGGTIYLIGVLAGGASPLNLVPVLMRNVRIQGVIVGPRETLDEMNLAIEANGMRPPVDRVFALDDVHDAFEYLASGAHMGKVVVKVG